MPDYSTWYTKDQAAEALEVCTATVQDLQKAGKLESVMWKRPTGGMKIRVYNPADVERERKERIPDAPPFVMPKEKPSKAPKSQALIKSNGMPGNPLQALMEAARNLQLRTLNPSELRHKLFLTAEEAVAYTGLSIARLRDAAKRGDGIERIARGGKMQSEVFRRSDLDKL